MNRMGHTFTRQGLPMLWDYVETNPFAGAGGDFQGTVESLCEVLDRLPVCQTSMVGQADAVADVNHATRPLISTDPPYYDNVGYADLSDFFYVWLRRTLAGVYPDLFSTLLTPKVQELIASPYRFNGDSSKAEEFFEVGLKTVFTNMRMAENTEFPLTVYYAFKQSEIDKIGREQCR